MEFVFFASLFAAISGANAQEEHSNIGCFVDYECTKSQSLDYTNTESAQACLQFCQDTLNCDAFTYYAGSSGCLAFLECGELDVCDDCQSGDVVCADLRYSKTQSQSKKQIQTVYKCSDSSQQVWPAWKMPRCGGGLRGGCDFG